MDFQTLLPTLTSICGGFIIGIVLGYFVKKIIKIIMFTAGGIVGLLLYLQQQQIISLNTEKLESSSTSVLNSIDSSFDKLTQIVDATTLGNLLTASMTAGFTVGIMKG